MGLREDALAAAEAARTSRVAAARAHLATVLAPSSVDGLEVVAELVDQVVLCGDEVCLAVRDDGKPGVRVALVTDDAGWTFRGEVTSLAQLGVLLAGLGA